MDQQSGWYPDPDGPQGRLRWWDGDRWTDLTTSGPTPAGGPDRSGAGPELRLGPEEEMLVGPGGVPLGERVRLAVHQRWRTANRTGRLAGAVVGLVLVLVVGLLAWNTLLPAGTADTTGDVAAGSTLPAGPPTPDRPMPPLARLCPAGQTAPGPSTTPSGPATTGPRINDADTGISYVRLGAPWQPWDRIWIGGVLGVRYQAGYYLVTQKGVGGGPSDYYATVLSGSVPATVGDALHPDMGCVAREVAEDARRSFYPDPNSQEMLAAHPVTVSGHPGYLVSFHLSFDVPGYDATGELAEILVLDVGTPRVAVLYVSIPDTHQQYDPVADQVIASVSVP